MECRHLNLTIAHKIRQRKKKTQDSQFLSKFEYSLSTIKFQYEKYKDKHLIYTLRGAENAS